MSRESDANDTRVDALEALEESRAKLHAWRFLNALKTATQAERDAAAQAMLDVAVARQALSAAILADIVAELEQEKAALKTAISDLERAVKKLDQVKGVIDAIGALVGVVGRIVSLV